MNWLAEQWRLVLPLALGWICVWCLLPRGDHRSRVLGGLFGLAAALCAKFYLLPPAGDLMQETLFLVFGFTAVAAGVLMVTDRHPVYAALWFAVATLGVCGLFLLNSAPFLSAATIIVYAGAIIVTFLFVIALAQQSGESQYDRRTTQPFLASLTGFVLLGCLLFTLQEWGGRPAAEGTTATVSAQFLALSADSPANLGSRADGQLGTLRALGRSLFTDYLYAVELAGTALLIATITAICLAPRRAQGHL